MVFVRFFVQYPVHTGVKDVRDMFGPGKKKINMKWASLVFADPIQHPERITEEMLHQATEMQVSRRCEIIMESIEIVRRTKNEDTRRSRADLCRKHYSFFMELMPYVDRNQKARIQECEKAMQQAGII